MSNLAISNIKNVIQAADVEQLLDLRGTRGLPSSNEFSSSSPAESGKSFAEVFKESVQKVNEDQVNADTSIKDLIAGRNKNIHETMLAVEKADTSLKLMMQVRNKVLDAYKEIMRMQV